ncbi:hypothetical protein ACVILE_000125 [Streptomyces sp. M18.1]
MRHRRPAAVRHLHLSHVLGPSNQQVGIRILLAGPGSVSDVHQLRQMPVQPRSTGLNFFLARRDVIQRHSDVLEHRITVERCPLLKPGQHTGQL